VAEAENAGLLVIGAPKGRVGTTAQRLLHGAPCPVSVAPHGWAPRGRLETIGAAYVDSDEAREALRSAHTLARHAGATLRVITVVRVTRDMYDETEAYVPPTPGKDLDHVAGEHRVEAEGELRRVVAELGSDVPIEVDALVGDRPRRSSSSRSASASWSAARAATGRCARCCWAACPGGWSPRHAAPCSWCRAA
jgi:nucleotide-binding universal stress UspA family protein